MKGRATGLILRGDAVYYTFQRLATALRFLERQQERKGHAPKSYIVKFTWNGEEREMSGQKFSTWANGLKSLEPAIQESDKPSPGKKHPNVRGRSSLVQKKKPKKVVEPDLPIE